VRSAFSKAGCNKAGCVAKLAVCRAETREGQSPWPPDHLARPLRLVYRAIPLQGLKAILVRESAPISRDSNPALPCPADGVVVVAVAGSRMKIQSKIGTGNLKWKFCSNTFHQPSPQSVSVVSISWASGSLATRPKQKELLAAQRARAAEHDEMSLPYQCCRDNHRLRNLAIELPYLD
jgi:hypothetical protein